MLLFSSHDSQDGVYIWWNVSSKIHSVQSQITMSTQICELVSNQCNVQAKRRQKQNSKSMSVHFISKLWSLEQFETLNCSCNWITNRNPAMCSTSLLNRHVSLLGLGCNLHNLRSGGISCCCYWIEIVHRREPIKQTYIALMCASTRKPQSVS